MTKINKIKLGAIVFDVVRKDSLMHPDGRRLDGNIVYSESRIYLDTGLTYQAELQTLWHEILHALLTQSGNCKDEDERIVDALAYGIMMALDNNPQLADVKPK